MHDLILYNANAVTMDPARPRAELVAVEDGRIAEVGGNDLLGTLKDRNTRVVDCGGLTLLPGFIDAHCHLHAYAESLVTLNFSPRQQIRSIADIQTRIADFCGRVPPGTWVRGKGYDEFHLAEKRHPDRRDLDAVSPLHPVKLTHRSGHAHVLNSLALKIAGIGEETGDPPEGFMDRAPATGLPTGVLYGFGKFLSSRIPPLGDVETERGAASANEKLLSFGITSIYDASFANGLEQWKRFESWKTRGFLQPRITMMTGLEAFLRRECDSCLTGLGSGELRLGGVKIIADEVTGILHPCRAELNEAVSAIHAAGRQAVIHAIEEPVIEAAAGAIEAALEKDPRKDSRHRIEHCSVCRPTLLQRLAKSGIVVVTQPSFIYFSGDRYLQTVPAGQLEYLYPVKSMLDRGLRVGAGSDFPIAGPNPLVSICAAATRRTEQGAALPQQRISVTAAMALHTTGAAAAAFEEGVKGSLTPGKFADIVMLSENPLAVEPDTIKDIKVVMTVLGGRIVKDSRFEI